MATSGTWEISWASGTWSGYPKAYHWAGSFSRSGNTISLSNMRLWFTVSGSSASAYGITDSVTVTGGSAQTVTWNFSGSTTSNIVWLNNTSFSVGTSDTSANIQCIIAGEVTGSTTIYFDPAYVAPATPTISATASGPNTISVTYGTTSFGNPSSGTVTLYGGTSSSPTTSLNTNNTTGNKTFSHTGLVPGITYHYRARANNGQLSSNYSTEITVTTPFIGMYGSVNGITKKVVKLYGSVNGQTKEIKKLYGSVNGVTKRIF